MKDAYYYLQGKIRYWMHYNYPRMIRPHITEQIVARVLSMNKKCYNDGSCKECGCTTTALQMCNKPCDGDCYPRMMSAYEWARFNVVEGAVLTDWRLIDGKFIKK